MIYGDPLLVGWMQNRPFPVLAVVVVVVACIIQKATFGLRLLENEQRHVDIIETHLSRQHARCVSYIYFSKQMVNTKPRNIFAANSMSGNGPNCR